MHTPVGDSRTRGFVNRTQPTVVDPGDVDDRIDMVLGDGAITSLWWATKNEWLGLIDVAGLELETLDVRPYLSGGDPQAAR